MMSLEKKHGEVGMDKERRIQDLKMQILLGHSAIGQDCDGAEYLATELVEAGYGNVKQAVQEYVNKLKVVIEEDDFEQLCEDGAASKDSVFDYIDNLFKELYGE